MRRPGKHKPEQAGHAWNGAETMTASRQDGTVVLDGTAVCHTTTLD